MQKDQFWSVERKDRGLIVILNGKCQKNGCDFFSCLMIKTIKKKEEGNGETRCILASTISNVHIQQKRIIIYPLIVFFNQWCKYM